MPVLRLFPRSAVLQLLLLLLLLSSSPLLHATTLASSSASYYAPIIVTLPAPPPCVDDASFRDAQGYDCAEGWSKYDCYALQDAELWGLSILEMQDIILHCPLSCGGCPDGVAFRVKLADRTTGDAAEVVEAADDGPETKRPFESMVQYVSDPLVNDLEDVTQEVFLPVPGCYRASVSGAPKYEARSSFIISSPSFPSLSVSAAGTDDPRDFCLTACPPATPPSFSTSGFSCLPCPPGTFTSASTGSCLPCPRSTYQPEPSSTSCYGCPVERPYSKPGAIKRQDCLPLANGVYAAASENRIVAYKPDLSSFVTVVDETSSSLSYPKSIAFVSEAVFVVANYNGGRVDAYEADDGRLLGTVAELVGVWTLLYDGTRDALIVSTYNADVVYLLPLSGVFGTDRVTGRPKVLKTFEAEDFVVVSGSASELSGEDVDYTLSMAFSNADMTEVVVVLESGALVRMCVATESICNRASRDRQLLVRDPIVQPKRQMGYERFKGVVAIPSAGIYLVVNAFDFSVSRCPIEPNEYDAALGDVCDTLISDLNACEAIAVDYEKELLLLANGRTIRAYSYEGAFIGLISEFSGDILPSNYIALRPGIFPALCTLDSIRSTARDPNRQISIAGQALTFPFLLYDAYNRPWTTSPIGILSIVAYASEVEQESGNDGDASRLLAGGVDFPARVSLSVEAGRSNGLDVTIAITKAGLFDLSVQYGAGKLGESFGRSPYEIRVMPGSTSPKACEATLQRMYAWGMHHNVTVSSYDEYKNPTVDDEDTLWYWWGTSIVTVGTASSMAFERGVATFDMPVLGVGSHLLFIGINGFEETDLLAGAPFSIEVTTAQGQKDDSNEGFKVGLIAAFVSVFFVALVVGVTMHKRTKNLRRLFAAEHDKNEQLKEEVQSANSVMQALARQIDNFKHTEEELKLMAEEREKTLSTRDQELREVLIPSSAIELESRQILGKGSFGVINLGVYKGEKVAVKQLLQITEEAIGRFRFECFLMKNLRHHNVIKLLGVVWDNRMLACVLELASNGSLGELLKKDYALPLDQKLTWKKKILRFAQDAAQGIQYLHESRYYDEVECVWRESIVHRDLKPDNMLLVSDWTLKISDFGEARSMDKENLNTVVGTPIFMAPEVLMQDHVDNKADVFAFSMCLVAMLRMEETVLAYFMEELRKLMKKPTLIGIGVNLLNSRMFQKNWRPSLHSNIFPSLRRIINQGWSTNPSERPTMEAIIGVLSGELTMEVNLMEEPDLEALEGMGGQTSLSPPVAIVRLETEGEVVTTQDILSELIEKGIVTKDHIEKTASELKEKRERDKLARSARHSAHLAQRNVVRRSTLAQAQSKKNLFMGAESNQNQKVDLLAMAKNIEQAKAGGTSPSRVTELSNNVMIAASAARAAMEAENVEEKSAGGVIRSPTQVTPRQVGTLEGGSSPIQSFAQNLVSGLDGFMQPALNSRRGNRAFNHIPETIQELSGRRIDDADAIEKLNT